MKARQTLKVVPRLPERLARLLELAYNLRWSWNHETVNLFVRLDRDLWDETGHNPVLFLGRIRQDRLESAVEDVGFLAYYDQVLENFDQYTKRNPLWVTPACGNPQNPCIAYFSAEFGLTECLPLYSGGLGVLAGDHLKSASDLGLPLVGIGILYQHGYFRQRLSSEGWQQELYPESDFHNLPTRLCRRDDGEPVAIEVEFPGRMVRVQVWQVQVGRIRLFLLDTNVAENSEEDRRISRELYGGDLEMRIKQEILLGIGGVRALKRLGFEPKVFHMNEGHSAFLALERIRSLLATSDLTFAEAREAAAAGHVFTTHTPVAAGIDVFPSDLVGRYFEPYLDSLKLSLSEFVGLGRQNPQDDGEGFSMAVLAIRLACHINGVSKLHAQVSRKMWHGLWPEFPLAEVPILPVTNGVHYATWTSRELVDCYGRYFGPRWEEAPEDPELWHAIDSIPDHELWAIHQRKRQQLVMFARQRLEEQVRRRQESSSDLEAARAVLDPEALTLGFARRVVTYKRVSLIFRDLERITRIFADQDRPVQLLMAGKAHPRDDAAKTYIREIVHIARESGLAGRVVFLEDYDINIARSLVMGADIWLNNPRRPKEASGTSGMKAAVNGVLNLSVLDGWWDEAYQAGLGWAIGGRETGGEDAYLDELESHAIYEILEQEIVPLFYQRDEQGIPHGWVRRMKAAMKAFGPVYNTHRMVREYADKFYGRAAAQSVAYAADGFSKARTMASWKASLREHWAEVRIEAVEAQESSEVRVGTKIEVTAKVELGNLSPEDVEVEIYSGPVDSAGEILEARSISMTRQEGSSNGHHLYTGSVDLDRSGLHGYSIRVRPAHEDGSSVHDLGLIHWQ